MNVLVATDNNYLKYLKVLMASVYANNDTNVDFYILHDTLTEEDQKSMSAFTERFSQKVYFVRVDINRYGALLSQFKSARYSPPTLFPLFAHELLSDDMDRVLYLDIDMAVTGSLTDFYNLDFDGCYLIASRPQYNVKDEPEEEFAAFDRVDNFEISHAAAGDYFNSGAYLLNLERLRNEKIDVNYYVDKIRGVENIFMDQGILNICFAKEAKILTTCRYNYRLHYSAKDYFKRSNNYSHGKREYTFYPLEPKIIHYCGLLPGGGVKSWTFFFERESEIGDPRKEFFDLIPESVPYFNQWWKYAKMTPDYEQLLMEAKINTAAYKMVRKITLEKRQEFCNSLALESYYVPAGTHERNSVFANDDLNKYTRPGVYRCANAQLKTTIQNLPRTYTENCGFRLIVKHIHSNARKETCTSTIQIIELNHPSAKMYRRYCGNPEKNNWGNWHEISEDQMQREEKLIKENLSIKNSVSWKITKPLRWFAKNLRTLKKKVKKCFKK